MRSSAAMKTVLSGTKRSGIKKLMLAVTASRKKEWGTAGISAYSSPITQLPRMNSRAGPKRSTQKPTGRLMNKMPTDCAPAMAASNQPWAPSSRAYSVVVNLARPTLVPMKEDSRAKRSRKAWRVKNPRIKRCAWQRWPRCRARSSAGRPQRPEPRHER